MVNKDKSEEWSLKIVRVDNGYILMGWPNDTQCVIEMDKFDELKGHEELLRDVMDYFDFQGSKHDAERLQITRVRSGNE
jgi:hypothetical protein